jgi:AcrR family transcriptional regulator
MVATRQTRDERKAQTRADLLAAARNVFLARGFHGATLDEIAEAAGYTKGAVYSNFVGKDALFVAVLEEHQAQRVKLFAGFLLEEPTPEVAYRTVARLMLEADAREPEWSPLVAEFLTYAVRDPGLRAAVADVRERFLGAIGDVIQSLADRHGIQYVLPPKEIARGSGALARGMAIERRLNPDGVPDELFEEIHTAYMVGMTKDS